MIAEDRCKQLEQLLLQAQEENKKLRERLKAAEEVIAAHGDYLKQISTFPKSVEDCDCTGCRLVAALAKYEGRK